MDASRLAKEKYRYELPLPLPLPTRALQRIRLTGAATDNDVTDEATGEGQTRIKGASRDRMTTERSTQCFEAQATSRSLEWSFSGRETVSRLGLGQDVDY